MRAHRLITELNVLLWPRAWRCNADAAMRSARRPVQIQRPLRRVSVLGILHRLERDIAFRSG